MFSLMPLRHIPTLPISPIHAFDANVRFGAEAIIDRTADMGGLSRHPIFVNDCCIMVILPGLKETRPMRS